MSSIPSHTGLYSTVKCLLLWPWLPLDTVETHHEDTLTFLNFLKFFLPLHLLLSSPFSLLLSPPLPLTTRLTTVTSTGGTSMHSSSLGPSLLASIPSLAALGAWGTIAGVHPQHIKIILYLHCGKNSHISLN